MNLISLTGILGVIFLVDGVLAQDASSFIMFPMVGVTGLAANLGWTEDCVVAMNATLNCDSDLYRMAGQIDNYLWSEDNITALCTSDCIADSSTWVANVEEACLGQTYSVASKLVPVDTVAFRYVEGITLACLKSNDLPFNYTSDPDINDESLVSDQLSNPNSTSQVNGTSGAPLYDATDVVPSSNGTDDPFGPDNVTDPAYYQGPTWCFLESQSWTGVEVEPDCDTDPTNVFCTDADSMTRMANLYYDTTLCSPCFLTVMWYRINSIFLPDTDHSDYLIEQYQDILDVCEISMPETVIRALPDYAAAPPVTYLPPGTDPASNSSDSGTSSGICTGQTLSADSSGCDSLSQQYGVTTGALQTATGSDDCTVSNTTCVPKACTLQLTSSGDSCADLAASFTTSTLNVSTTLFMSWNPNIIGLCDNLAAQYVCSAPPGGAYTLPAPINGTNADAAGQDRGGQGPTGVVPTTNSTAAAPTQAGISSNCTMFAYAASGDTCFGFTQSFSISMADFTTWNPVLGYPDGHNCTTQFWLGYDYCVQVNGGDSTTTTTTTTSPTTASSTSLPYPTQSGIISTCNKFKDAETGDYCSKFASDNGITTAQLYAWNAILGTNGENCGTLFQAGVDYCVGVSSTATTTTTSVSSTSTLPYPTQSGIISTCNKFKDAETGDYCSKFASDNGITTAQLYAWNAILGSNGENCGTLFQAGVDYCIGVSSNSATTTTSSSIPTQSGIASNCNKIVVAQSGDYCYIFAQDNNITTAQLYAWNPILGANGENCSTAFQLGEGYCVSVSS